VYATVRPFSGGINQLFRNDGGGTFVEMSSYPATNTRSDASAWGDYDEDGDPDLFLGTSPTSMSDWLLRNDGGGAFSDVTPSSLAGPFDTRAAAWGDLDDDGDLDLFLGGAVFRHARNDGGGIFTPLTSSVLTGVGGESYGVLLADGDADGDLDALSLQPNTLFESVADGDAGWLRVRLTGSASSAGLRSGAAANRAAIGARVRVVAGGASRARTVSGGDGRTQPPLALHFGLGSAAVVDTLEITWPGSGLVESYTGLSPDLVVHAIEGQGIGTGVPAGVEPPASLRLPPAAPNPFREATRITFELPRDGAARLAVYDVSGRLVRVLLDGPAGAGRRVLSWDARDGAGRRAAAGTYFYRLDAAGTRATRRVVLLR
jgi:hypothetical protein